MRSPDLITGDNRVGKGLSLGGFLSFLAAHLGLRDPDKKSYILQEVPVLYLPKDHLS